MSSPYTLDAIVEFLNEWIEGSVLAHLDLKKSCFFTSRYCYEVYGRPGRV